MTISPITLGNSFSGSGSTTVLGGLSSGLNTQSIITAALAGQQTQVTNLQDQITVNNNQASALSSLNQLLLNLQNDTTALSTPQNPDAGSNVFASRTTQITSNTTLASSNFLTATADTATATGTYTISNITQIATSTVQESNGFSIANADTSVVTASPTAGMFTAGTFIVNGESITLTAGETLNQVAAAFNAANAAIPSTGISASVLQTASGVFKLILNGASTGVANGFDLNATQTNALSVASADAPATGAGKITAGTYTVNGQSVVINSGDSLNQIANDFNSASAGVTATVVQVGTGSYKLVFTGNTADLATNASSFDLATSSNVTSGSSALSNVLFTTDQAAQDAQFQFNGVSIDRASNSVSDLVNGVTFNLLQNTNTQPNASFTVSVTADTNAITSAIQSFANDYNAFLTFYAQQTQVDSTTGQPATSAVLNSDTTLRSIYAQLTSYASSIINGTSGVSTLSDVGVNFSDTPANGSTPDVPNTLQVNTTTLANTINSNLAGVESIFGYNPVSSSANLGVFSGPTDQSITHFTVNVTQSSNPPVYTVQYTDSHGVQQTVNMTAATIGTNELALTAPSDSGLAGLVLIYSGAGDETGMTVNATNGIAYMMNALASSVTASTGMISTDQQAIATKTQTTQTQINNVNTQITNTQNTLLAKFSALEAAIASANSALNFLNAQQLAASGNG